MVRMYRDCFALILVCCFGMLVEPAHCQSGPGIKYIENKNQWPEEVDFSARIPGGRMYISPGRFTYSFLDEGRLEQLHLQSHSRSDGDSESHSHQLINGHTVGVEFIGANNSAIPMSFGKSSEYYNYFLGNDSCTWASRAYAYDGFIYGSFYNGVDLKVYSEGDNVKYDFIVAPGANPEVIAIAYDGHESLAIDKEGDLIVATSVSSVREKKPVAYQYIDGARVMVPCRYLLKDGQLKFSFPNGYDPCHELVIDPLLIFSTYSGSTADNWGSTATPGEKGNLYSAGVTNLYVGEPFGGGTFPATPGAFQTVYGGLYDIGILKYDSSGQQLLYATYLGGSEQDSPESLVMNDNEELLVLGVTGAADFPTSTNGFDKTFNGGVDAEDNLIGFGQGTDIFVSRISREGDKLLSSTFLGGSENDGMLPQYSDLDKNYGDMLRGDIITDDDNNVYISSVTSSNNFPAVNGLDLTYNGGPADAVIAKLDPDLSTLQWATFLGGTGTDASLSIKFDLSGNIYLAGGTTSGDFPVTPGSYQLNLSGNADGWIAKMNNAGSVLHNATFTGTTAFDQIYFLDLNESDEVFVYGQTTGSFPITPGVYSNPNSGQFIQKFNSSLNALIFSTVIGSGRGTPDISPTAFLVNECNNLYLSGWGGSINYENGYWISNTLGMPITDDAFQKTTSGSDFYFMVLTDDASQLLYGTYLGGAESKTHVDGGTSRFDKGGIVYHAVCSGCRSGGQQHSDFPTTPGAWSATNNSFNCNNAAFKFDLSSLKARLQSNSVEFDMPGLSKVCMPDKYVFQNLSTGGETFEWDLGDGTKLTKVDTSFIVHQYSATGRYTVTLKAIDRGTCKVEDVASIKVDVFVADTEVQDDDDMCLNSPYTLKASGGAIYDWRSEDGSFSSSAARPVVNPSDTTRYFVTITERTGCVKRDTVQLNVIPLIVPEFEIDRSAECLARPHVSVMNLTDSLWNGDALFFDFGDGSTSDQLETEHTYEKDGMYNIKLVGVREFCVSETVVPMPVFSLLIPNIITPGNEDGTNDKFTIQYGDTPGTTPADYGFKTAVVIYNRWGDKVYESPDYQYNWTGDGLPAGIYFFEITVDQHSTCKSWIQLVK